LLLNTCKTTMEHSSSFSNETKPLKSNNTNFKKPWYLRLHKLETRTYIQLTFLLSIIVLIGLAIAFNQEFTSAAVSFLKWMRNNPVLGSFVFVLVYFSATVLLLPGSIFTIGAGFVFAQVVGQVGGVFLGTLVVFLGATSGATVAFIIARYILRSTIENKAKNNKKFGIIDKVVELNGLKVTFLLRLAPIVPFNIFNYFMGITSVTLYQYCLAHFGLLPGTFVYVFLGTTLSSVADASGAGFTSNKTVLIILIVLLVVAFIGIFLLSYYAKKQFNKYVKEIEEREKKEGSKNDDEQVEMVNKQQEDNEEANQV